jgi:hypothetical protein
MLNEIVKNQMIILEYHTLHLFLTSQPNVPISSFEHDKLHFNYQVYLCIYGSSRKLKVLILLLILLRLSSLPSSMLASLGFLLILRLFMDIGLIMHVSQL